ncbi:60S acidic ribosomal protein P2 beta (H6.4) [Trypanosoma cruzi]|uniref:Putative 60S acidic ribosomal protein P2 beta (H6.4) n=1 Tax=Trypanosoma cruzi TaxID=5693 RepID=A0A2V2UG83_TRYCR|nr:putative 60S acidic ribosomal protein P2 [Trypanosoma cruzi]PBJ76595.1 60S acidic ribosomal protein P2 beta (H6.4) [Trypanosoma cruzi cruzi]PBJ79300.1 60S acidic ribosomal protein P2 beta (H6.4) [Trypanosoma cruzi cruzi]PBJ80998.1 60S acidic ribosomal protein P2 beta (H6.4) [Trypanosoma cruzi cruzi]PWU83229.1 putative 60S acidic ribosomal protein P2 beta (H6.4) [Trypanosoma cruzi]
MKYLAAYALVGLSGGTPSKSAVEAVLKAAGVPVDPSRVDALFTEFAGKDFDTVCTEGKSKLVGGVTRPNAATASAPTAAAAASSGAAAPAAAAEEEEDDDMGFGLFD